MPHGIDVLPRAAPSAHLALVGTTLVDAGSAAGVERVARFLAGRPVELIVLTHAHTDHAGGAAALRERLGAPIALHPADLPTIARDAEALRQTLDPFTVDHELRDGDELPGGLTVVATPSQTPGHVAFHHAASGTVLTGDLLQADDVAWMPFTPDALDLAIAAVRRIAALRPRLVVPGHGPPVTDVARRAEETVARYELWRADPARRVGHHVRRVAAAWLALHGTPWPTREEADAAVAAIPMLADAAALTGAAPPALARTTLDELLGSGAVALEDDRLVPRFPVESPSQNGDLAAPPPR